MLFEGDGVNFSKGVFDEEMKQTLKDNGWFYDIRFSGIRSNANVPKGSVTEITLNVPSLTDSSPISLEYGQYTFIGKDGNYGYVINSNNMELLNMKNKTGFNFIDETEINDGIFKIGYSQNSSTREGINGIVINRIGDSVYSDPELSDTLTINNDYSVMNRSISITLNAQEEIPSNVYVIVTDNMSHTYTKYWRGEPITFVLPYGYDFIVYAKDFITENGKVYRSPLINISDETIMNINYTANYGMELQDNTLCLYTEYTDYFINLNIERCEWGTLGIDIHNTNSDDILLSEADGFKNTHLIANMDKTSICSKSIETKWHEKDIVGYIPSYIEIEILSQYLNEINTFLKIEGREEITLIDCWVSETYDKNNAWTSDGIYIPKNEKRNCIILGKKIIL
jgi:hypothetical protein